MYLKVVMYSAVFKKTRALQAELYKLTLHLKDFLTENITVQNKHLQLCWNSNRWSFAMLTSWSAIILLGGRIFIHGAQGSENTWENVVLWG